MIDSAVQKPNPIHREVLARIDHNNNHDTAVLLRESDPDGLSVEHRLVTTQRMIDRLRESSRIDDLQHHAGTILRDNYERARPSVGALVAVDPGAPFGSRTEPELIANEDAWKIYRLAMQQAGQWNLILRFVVIEDRAPEGFGYRFNCAADATLTTALDRLVRHFEYVGLIARGTKPRRGTNA